MPVAHKLVMGEWCEDSRSISLLVLLLGCAALCKETYAATVPLGLFLYLWHFRRKAAAASCVTLFLAYVAYRCWLVGLSAGGGYYDTLPNPAVFVQFLARLPYVFAANAGGYLLIVLAIWSAIRLCREGKVGWRVALSTLAVCAACLIVIYRGALPLYGEWLDPGTWYRIVFLLESMLLLGSAYLFARMPNQRFGYIAAFIAFPVLLCGGTVTKRKWDLLSKRYEIEGKYYLKHFDRLVYSEVPAGWFLDGIQHLYDLRDRHHVVAGMNNRNSRSNSRVIPRSGGMSMVSSCRTQSCSGN